MSSEGMEKRIELLAMILNSAAFRELDCHAQYVKMKKAVMELGGAEPESILLVQTLIGLKAISFNRVCAHSSREDFPPLFHALCTLILDSTLHIRVTLPGCGANGDVCATRMEDGKMASVKVQCHP